MTELETVPGNRVIMEQLEADFPRDFDDFSDVVGAAVRSEEPEDRVIVAANNWITNFFANHSNDFAAAPMTNLDAVIDLELGLLQSLKAHDEFACADYAKGEPQDQPLPEELDQEAGAIVAARFSAIRAGRSDQQLRLLATPSDFDALQQTMADRGLNQEQIAVAFGQADSASIGAPLACKMAIELVNAIRDQPEERRALLIGAYVTGQT